MKQSARSLNDATKDFRLSVKAGQVLHDEKNSLLTWSVVNAIISAPNSFGEIKIDKMTQENRIDPIDALIDAWKIWFTLKDESTTSADDAVDEWLGAIGSEEK